MANIFAILTAVVLAVAAFLAYVNTGRSDENKRGYRGWINQRQATERSLDNNQKTLAKLQGKLTETSAELADYNTRNEGLQVEVDAQLDKNKKLAADVESKKALAASKAAEVKEREENFVPIEDVKAVIAKLQRTKDQLRDLGLSIDEKEAATASLEGQKRSTENTIAELKEKISWPVNSRSNPELRTRVRSVYEGLGFVTLAGGWDLGIVKNSSLDVERDGEVIGKLIVTTVEASTAAADIVPDSVASGDAVRPGDQVVAEKKNK